MAPYMHLPHRMKISASLLGLGAMLALVGCAAAPTDEGEATGDAFTASDKAGSTAASSAHATFILDEKECTVPAANIVLKRGIQEHGWTATAIVDSCGGEQMILTVSGSDDAGYPQTATKTLAG
jgi:hypothetical protein